MEGPKKRGRPPGKKRRPLNKWDPQKWDPLYDQMVIFSIQGKKNEDIAKFFNYSPQQVSNILTSQKAQEVKAIFLQQGRNKLAETFDGRAKQVADLTLKRAHELLTDDERYARNPFAVINAGLAVSRTLLPEEVRKPGTDRTGDSGVPNQINIGNLNILSSNQLKEIASGLEKLQEVKKLHA